MGKNINTITEQKISCYKCKHSGKYYKKTDVYIEAVAKLYEEDLEEEKLGKNKKEERKKWFINKKTD